MKKFITVTTLIASLTLISLTGCGNNSNKNTDASVNSEANSEINTIASEFPETTTTETETTGNETTEDTTTEEVPEEPVVIYAEWIDTLYTQMMNLDFDTIFATISQPDFIEKCSGYESGSVSTAYENQRYVLPVSSGDEIGVVVVASEITVFICPNGTDDHMSHGNGFQMIGYGDIAAVYSENGTVTCDGVHVKSTKRGQSSFDMEPKGIWIIWSV